MSALLEGELSSDGGCVYVGDYLVVWPDDVWLTLGADGVPTVMEDDQSFGRIGTTIRLGGGEWPRDQLPEAARRCDGMVWLASEVIEPE